MRGGEPDTISLSGLSGKAVPTCVGVNRSAGSITIRVRRCPHMRGGEPVW